MTCFWSCGMQTHVRETFWSRAIICSPRMPPAEERSGVIGHMELKQKKKM